MTAVNMLPIIGQSNGISFGTGGIAYPGGWTPASFGAGFWAEPIWNGSGFVQYNAGVTSSFFSGLPQYWGPETTIALGMRALTPQLGTCIIKYCLGGIGLAVNQGQRGADGDGGSWSPWQSGKTLDGFYSFLGSAIADLVAAGYTVNIPACYWVGNESDCFDWASASSVAHDLPKLINAIRTRFSVPDMKFIIARTNVNGGSGASSPSPGLLPYVDIVRTAQEAAGSGYRCAWVNTDDLTFNSDGHFNYASVPTLGTRMFNTAQAIT